MQARNSYGERAIGDYIVSGTESADDVQSVLLLARWANITDRASARCRSTSCRSSRSVSALEGAGAAAASRCSPSPSYRRHLAARGRAPDRAARIFGEQPGDRHRGLAPRDLPGAGRADRGGREGRASTLRCSMAAAGPRAAAAGRSSAWSRTRPTARPAGGCARPSRARASATAMACGALRCGASRRPCSRSAMDRIEIPQARRRASASSSALMASIAAASRARYRALVHEQPEFLPFLPGCRRPST